MNIMDYFKIMLCVQLFFGFSITALSYALPDESLVYISEYTTLANSIDLKNTSAEIQAGLESQTNIPVIEIGALIFYSGNLLIDLLLNSLFAIPEMIGLLVGGLFAFINVNAQLTVMVLTFIQVSIAIVYFIGLLQLLTGIRSGQVV